MSLWLRLAWRNVFRNKRRTYITGVAIGVGLASLIYVDAIILGFEENMVHTATSSFLGEGQIHREGFREFRAVDETIANLMDKQSLRFQNRVFRCYVVNASNQACQ